MATVPEFATLLLVALVTGAVATAVLAANPRRNWNQWLAFFLFLICGNYSAQATTVSLHLWQWAGEDPGDATLHLVESVAFVFLVLDPAALAYFASVFPRRAFPVTRRSGIAALGLLVLFFSLTEVFLRGLSRPDHTLSPVRVLFFLYVAAAYLYAAWRLISNFVREPSGIMAHQVRIVALGVLVVTLSRTALLANDFGPALDFLGSRSTIALVQLAARLAALWGLFLLTAAWIRRQDLGPARREEAGVLLRLGLQVFLLLSALWIFERATQAAALAGTELPKRLLDWASYVDHSLTFAVRWFVFCATMIYGIVRYQALAVKTSAVAWPGAIAVAALFFLAVGAAATGLGPWVGAGVATLFGFATFAAVYVQRERRRAAGGVEEYLRERRLEIYRALLAGAVSQGRMTPMETVRLQQARRRLQISDRDHEMLLAIAQSEEQPGHARPLLAGRYEPLRRVGAGSYGTVHLARDHRRGELVVLKQLWHESRQADAPHSTALRELEVARRVSHPNLVAIHDLERSGDDLLLVMEYVEGGTLRDALEREGKLDSARAAQIARQALDGLAALHQAGIAHGDLKPENILLTLESQVKLADFGSARGSSTRQTIVGGLQPDTPAGTLRYMAPERIREDVSTPRGDLYSLGAVCYEMLTGRAPLDAQGRSGQDMVRSLLEGPPVPQELPPGWEAFFRGALAPGAGQRFASAQAMANALPASPG